MNALDEIKNQNLASRILKGILKTRRIANAYLFAGPSGAGKKFAAVQFAKALICEKGGCETCSSCSKIQESSHPDVHLIATEQNKDSISIEQIRNMQKDVCLRPFLAELKVYIIEDAERMSEEATNSLLKILEEPPSDTVFILTTSSPQNIFPTIISRCQTVRFTRGLEIEKKNLEIVAEGEPRLGREEEIFSLINLYDISDVLRKIKNLVRAKEEAVEIVNSITELYRDVLLLKEKNEESITFKDRIEQLRDVEGQLSEYFLAGALKETLWARHMLARNVNPRLTVETLFLKIMQGENNG